MFAELTLNPSRQKLQEFGGGMTIVSLVAIPLLIYIFDAFKDNLWVKMTVAGIVLSLVITALRFLAPMALKPLFVIWVGASVLIGMVVAPIILTVVYYGVVTPVGLLSRNLGKTWIATQTENSYWSTLEPHKDETFERQF